MANTKISALTALTGANLATDDVFPVVDTSATATKRITVAELKLGIMPAPGPIGAGTASTGAFTTLSASGVISAPASVSLTNAGANSQAFVGGNGSGRAILNAPSGQEVDLNVNGATVLYATGTAVGTFQPLSVTGTTSTTTGMAVGGATAGAGGIAFPATAVAVANANTLDDYEEGTWTPTITSGAGTITTVGAVAGTYTKLGRKVTLSAQFAITTNGTGASVLKVNGLPFTGSQATVTYYCPNATNRSDAFVLSAEYNPGASNTINLYKYDGTYPGADGKTYLLSVTFNV